MHYRVSGKNNVYSDDPKLSDRQVLANHVDPDQEQTDQGPHCLPIRMHLWTHNSIVEPHCSNFRIITAVFRVSGYST